MKLGRFPFTAAIKHYLKRRYGTVADSTYIEEERKLRMLAGIFEGLKAEGRIASTDPRQLRREDIQEFWAWMKHKGLDPTGQAKYFQYLGNFLKVWKNHVLEEMKADGIRFPKPNKKPIRVIDDEDLETIFTTLQTMPYWRGSVARGMISLCFATAIRPKEVRLAHIEDLWTWSRSGSSSVTPRARVPGPAPEWVDIIRPDMLPLHQSIRDGTPRIS